MLIISYFISYHNNYEISSPLSKFTNKDTDFIYARLTERAVRCIITS